MAGSDARAKYTVTAEDKTKKALAGVKKNFGGVSGAIKALGATGLAVLGAAGLGAVVLKFAATTAKSLDDVAKSAKRLGTSVEELDSLTFAAELGGASGDAMAKAWKAASKAVVDAADGQGEAIRDFDRLGISARDSAGNIKSVSNVMIEFADALPRLASETEKTAAVQRIFGRAGLELLPMLRQGSAAMREQIIEGKTLSVRTGDLAQKGEDFVDAQLRLNRAMRSTKDVIGSALLPALSSMAETIANKLIGLVTGLSKEFRTFLATAALESPDVRIKLLNDRLIETKSRIAGMQEELETAESKNTGGIMGDVMAESFNKATRPLQELVDLSAELLRIQDRLVVDIKAAEKAKVDQLKVEREIRAARTFQAEQTLAELTASAKIEEAKVREKVLQDDITESIKETTAAVEELVAPEFDLKLLPTPLDMRDFIDKLGDIGFLIDDLANNFAGSLGDEMEQFVRTGKTGADIFGRAWKRAMTQLLGDLTAAIAKAAILASINTFAPGVGSFLGAIFKTGEGGGATGPVQKFGGTGAAGASGGVTFISQSLLPATTDDFLRADIAIQESNYRRERFAIASRRERKVA